MKQVLSFAALSAALVIGGALVAVAIWPGPDVSKTVWTSAAIALVTQLAAFGVARQFVAFNPMAAWGIGSLVRFAVLVFYAFVGVAALSLASGPALFSLAAFLFVTMVIEPLFLKN